MSTDTPRQLQTRSVLLFLTAVLALTFLIFLGQIIAWFLEQTATASESLAALGSAGEIWFVAQTVVVAVVCAAGTGFSRSPFRPVYQSWLIASLVTLPALAFRFLGPNQDQLGAFLQIGLGLAGGSILLFMRKRTFRFDRGSMLAALAIAPVGIWPFLLWGALGSGTDTLLNVLAGLAFGLLAASLVVTTEAGSILLDGLGIGVLLSILGSAFGYDGAQLLLISVLPSFGFVIRRIAGSVPATGLAIGLLAAGPLVFIDPTELSILLGDLMPWAIKAALLMAGNGLLLGLVFRLLAGWKNRPTWSELAAPILSWGLALVVYFGLGLQGSYGDRLFVILRDQADVSSASAIADRDQRTAFVYTTLTQQAEQSQAVLRKELDRLGIHYKPYYLVNAIEVDGGALIRLYLLRRPEVDRVLPSPRLRPLPQAASQITGYFTAPEPETGWNIEMIGADRVWDEFGITGKGIVVGQSDSGADGSHPALHDSYRGVDQGGDYNWYDPWNGTSVPTDPGGHGTHTLGIVLGQEGIGVAPGAQWIGCVNLARGLANPPFYLDCMQFMLAPFPQGGDPFKDGDPSRAAHVLNNSWGCPTLEGCDPESLRPAVEALRAAGIFVAASAGNDGPLCNTLTNPIALYDSVFSVGAVDRFGNMANFSSRGPVEVDGSGRVKPDIAAPGVDVFSSLPNGTYGPLSGTSMAGPHLAGVVALLWSANPDLIGDIDATEQILTDTAQPYRGDRPQGECFSGDSPSDAYGYGIVDAYAAVKLALER